MSRQEGDPDGRGLDEAQTQLDPTGVGQKPAVKYGLFDVMRLSDLQAVSQTLQVASVVIRYISLFKN